MDSQDLSAQAAEGNTPEPKYYTRYGCMSACETADNLLDRAWSRLRFLEEVFAIVHHDGDGFIMKGYSSCGLAAILEDIAIDVESARTYYLGEDDTPGKLQDAPEVKP